MPPYSPINRKHRDTLFRGYFKIPAHFICLHRHCKPDGEPLQIDDIAPFDLDSAITLRIRRNDVSFITRDNRLIILIEHQSTINPNIALRLLFYYMELLQLWIKINKVNLYGTTKLQDLPIPEFYVVYNGNAPLQETHSTFTVNCPGLNIDVQVKIIDIHYDKLTQTTPGDALAGYAYFYKVFETARQAGASPEEAFAQAREACIAQNHLQGFIEKEGFEMFYKDFLDYDSQLKAEGEGEGKNKMLTFIKGLMQGAPLEQLAQECNIPMETALSIKQDLMPA